MPRPAMTTAAALLSGGALLLILGLLGGERLTAMPITKSLGALLYLIVFGSIVGYTAYVYLLRHTRPVLATSYAYVNPAVAVLLGMALGAETFTGPISVALPLILSGVALVGLGQRQRRMTTPEALVGSGGAVPEIESRP
jgi:drug/metabolite transporter (DMT)-like permease